MPSTPAASGPDLSAQPVLYPVRMRDVCINACRFMLNRFPSLLLSIFVYGVMTDRVEELTRGDGQKDFKPFVRFFTEVCGSLSDCERVCTMPSPCMPSACRVQNNCVLTIQRMCYLDSLCVPQLCEHVCGRGGEGRSWACSICLLFLMAAGAPRPHVCPARLQQLACGALPRPPTRDHCARQRKQRAAASRLSSSHSHSSPAAHNHHAEAVAQWAHR